MEKKGTNTADAPARSRGFLRSFAADYKGIASLVGLLVYGVVRVSYDAYYTRLGVFPEAVGLTEVTILGRAALYLALTASIAVIFGGMWFFAFRWGVELAREGRAPWLTPSRLLAFTAVPAAATAALIAAPGAMRHFLGSHDFARYCFARCKLQPLDGSQLQVFHQLLRDHGSEHPSWDLVELGPAWLVGLPLVFLVAAAALAPLLGGRGVRFGVFGLLTLTSLSAGFLAPHLGAALEESLPSHGTLVKWTIFALLLVAVAAGLVAALRLVDDGSPRESPWPAVSFVAILPLLMGFLVPAVPLFIEEEGAAAVFAALVLWIALVTACFELWPDFRTRTMKLSARLVVVAAFVVASTLFLAWERGLNLAKQAAMGDQILPQRFDLLSVRAAVVCVEPTSAGARLAVPRRPYTYLGQADGVLVLYDFVADLSHDTPTAFPVRLPAGGAVVRLANYAPEKLPYWNCAKN